MSRIIAACLLILAGGIFLGWWSTDQPFWTGCGLLAAGALVAIGALLDALPSPPSNEDRNDG